MTTTTSLAPPSSYPRILPHQTRSGGTETPFAHSLPTTNLHSPSPPCAPHPETQPKANPTPLPSSDGASSPRIRARVVEGVCSPADTPFRRYPPRWHNMPMRPMRWSAGEYASPQIGTRCLPKLHSIVIPPSCKLHINPQPPSPQLLPLPFIPLPPQAPPLAVTTLNPKPFQKNPI